MLSREEAKQLLEMAFDAQMRILKEKVGGPYRNSRKGAVKSFQRSKLTEKFTCVQTEENLYPTAWERMQLLRAACILDEEDHLVLAVGSGIAGMNPAVVELCFHTDRLEIGAWAKEGLIKLHTVEKAINACLSALNLRESDAR